MSDGPQVIQRDCYPETYTKHDSLSTATYYHDPNTTNDKTEQYYEDGNQKQATILGLRRRNFWILVGLAMVVLAATIGGSIGGTMAVRKISLNAEPNTAIASPISLASASASTPSSASSTSASLSSATPYTVLALGQVASINVTCPSTRVPSLINGDPTMTHTDTYSYTCRENSGIAQASGNDLFYFTAYSLQQCIDACSQYNFMQRSPPCQGVVVEGNLNGADGRWKRGNGANCWLKEIATISSIISDSGLTTAIVVATGGS